MPFRPRVSQKQDAVIGETKRFPLITGPRNSSKSFGILHSIPWRMWTIQNYVGCMIGCTTSQNSDSGLWTLLTERIMEDWVQGRIYDDKAQEIVGYEPFGMDWAIRPRMEAVTHRLHFACVNQFGGISKYYLDSLKNESEVWERYRGKYFHDLYVTESDNFKSRRTFDCLRECLRVPGARYEDHRLVLDTNPPAEAEEHWLFELFFWFRTVDLDALSDEEKEKLNVSGFTGADYDNAILGLKELQRELVVHEFSVADNEFITDAQKRAQFAAYAHDKDLLDRMFYGRWTRSITDGIFSDTFRQEIHVIGERANASNPDPEVLLPQEGCFEMLGSWDIGSRRNTAAYIIEPVQVEVIENGETILKPGFHYLHEFASIGVQQNLAITCAEMMDRRDWVESAAGKKLQWRDWSDSSSFDPSGQTMTSEATDLYRMSNGEIELRSIVAAHLGMKGHGSVERRINLMQRLLFENRLLICAANCPQLIQMFKSIKRSRNGKLDAGSVWKHILDAASYGPAVECWFEMRKSRTRIRTNKEPDRVIVTSL
jgi:hypothetical protein